MSNDNYREDEFKKDEAFVNSKSVWIADALKLIVQKEIEHTPKRTGNEFITDLATLTAALISNAIENLPPNVSKKEVLEAFILEFANKIDQIELLKKDR